MIIFLVTFLTAVLARDIIDPKMILPNMLSVWRMNQKELIAWNGSYVQPDGLYYNNLTRLNINLYQLGNTTTTKKDELLATVIQNYPMTQNNVFWDVPANVSRTRDGVDPSSAMFYVKVYPSFFDWDGQCNGCLDKAPRSQLFVMLEANCLGEDCDAISDPYGDGGLHHDYNQAIKSVGIAVGAVAAVVLLVSIFCYTKKGMRTIKKLRTKRSGLIYKYNPPVVERLKPETGANTAVTSPLRNFFSIDNIPGTHHKSPTRQASLVNLGDKILRDSETARLSQETKPKMVLDLPPSPPKIYQKNSLLHRASNENGSQLFEPTENPMLKQQDAVLVANTFRNALRVTDLDDFSSVLSSTDSYLSQYYREEQEAPAVVGSAPRFDAEFPQSSPVLGRLATTVKENKYI